MKKNKIHTFFTVFLILLGLVFLGSNKVHANNTGLVVAQVQLAICGDGVKDHGEQCDLTDLHGKSCTDLGFDGGTLGCSFSCDFDTSGCTTSATAHAQTTLSPSADRTYILSDGPDSIGLGLLQFFYDSDLSLYLFSHPTSTTTPAGENLIGRFYNPVFVNENGDNVNSLGKVSTITLSYDGIDLGNTDENTLAPYRSSDGGSTWVAVPGYSLDSTAKTVTFSTSNISMFGIFGYPVSTSTSGQIITVTGGEGAVGGAIQGTFVNPPKATPAEKKAILKIADFNGDGRVDVVDLSILLYYFGKTGDQIKPYDLNKDGQIDIVDASIMLYYWQVTS